MSKWRQAAKIDANQPEIIKSLRKMPGVTVQLSMDDILVGYNGVTYWYEIKDPAKLFNKDSTFRKGEIKESQVKLLENWKGHYKIVWNLEMILEDIGMI